jgi:hypothetical protein
MRMYVRPLARHGAALATAAAALVMMAAHADAVDVADAGGAKARETKQIASSVLGEDVKFTLTAVRSTSDPLAASVRLKVYMERGGAWTLSDQILVGEADGWFWFPLTGSGAVCEFSTASTNPAPVAVSLLISPSIGCSPTERFEARNGRLSEVGGSVRTPHGGMSTGGGGTAGLH